MIQYVTVRDMQNSNDDNELVKYTSICDTQNCNIYKELISTLKYIPIDEAKSWTYKHSSFERYQKGLEIEESNCTKLLATNPHLLYMKMQQTITNKLAKDPDSISSKNLLKWLLSLDGDERFDFLKTVDDIGRKSSPSLVEKMQAVLNGDVSVNINHHKYFASSIHIPETFPANDVIYFLKTYGFESFWFASLKYFDMPIVMDEFCAMILSKCQKDAYVSISIYYLLDSRIKESCEELSYNFLECLHELLIQLYQIDPRYGLKECKKFVNSKLNDRQEEKIPSVSFNEKTTFHDGFFPEKPKIRECSDAEQQIVSTNSMQFDSITHAEGSDINKANGGTKRRGLLGFIKSLFKRS
jgi:hypothetical protein